MFLIEVAPLTKIPIQKPQVLSYFSSQQLSAGSLVLVPLGPRDEAALVLEAHQIKGHKLEIKKAEYELRPIKKIISLEPILTPQQIKLALWLGQYYFTSPGLFAKMMAQKKIRNPKSLPANNLNRRRWQAGETRNNFPACAEASAGRQIPNFPNFRTSKQKLILVPEISQIKLVQKKYTIDKTVIIHSGLKVKQLAENWQKIAHGQAEIIIGTRIAIFAPFTNLKEIIIEDESSPHHRSWDMFPHYRTHEVAHKLAEIFGARLILKSDLPSIESHHYISCHSGRTEIIDLRQELREGNFSIFSRKLQEAIKQILKNKQQVILFINRRGAATFVLCRDCGYVEKCPNCEVPLTYHFVRGAGANSDSSLKPALICHHCGYKSSPPTLCPKCQGHRIKAFGAGTQRVEMETKKIFKDAFVLRLDSDIAQTLEAQQKIIEQFRQKKADILIGTQMILNEQLPQVPLVAIMSADTLLHLPDFRSDERTFQIINQLKKFANPQFFIQTYNPESQVLRLAAKGDFKSFYQQEMETRKLLKYPPFSQLVKLTFRHRDPKKAAAEAKILFSKLTQQLNSSKPSHQDIKQIFKQFLSGTQSYPLSGKQDLQQFWCGGRILKEVILEIIGPAPAFISKERQKYIWQIVIKVKPYWLTSKTERQNLLKLRNQFLLTVPSGWEIDVDPETLL